MAKGKLCLLKYKWEDGVTIEERYFPSIRKAILFARREGKIPCTLWVNKLFYKEIGIHS